MSYTREKPRKLTLSTKLYFGKYKGTNKTIYNIIMEDVEYCDWLISIWEGDVDDKVKLMFNEFWERNNLNKKGKL